MSIPALATTHFADVPEHDADAIGPSIAVTGAGRIAGRHVIRVLIVDDHAVTRRGVRSLIEGRLRYAVAGEAANDEEALEVARRTEPDLVVLDCSHPRGD